MAEKMEVTPLTLTEDGLRLQAKVQTGLTKLNLVKVIIGYGFLDETESPLRITDVKNEIPSRQTGDSGSAPTVDLSRLFQDDEEAMSLITVTVQNGDNDFTYCREFLFLALDSTTDETIKYAYANLGENGLPLPKYNGKSHVAYNIDFPTAITNADDVEIHTTLVSGTPWDEFMNHVNNTDNPHNVTVEQIGAIPISAKGSAGGVAELDTNGLVPSNQLPSYVDDVIECDGISAFPKTGESGKIYVDTVTNLSYRWSGSQYTEISPSIALGETSSTAYRGDRGAEAYRLRHSHGNKTVLDGITDEDVSNWNNAEPHKAPTSAEVITAIKSQSPELAEPTANTPLLSDNSKRVATTAFVQSLISSIKKDIDMLKNASVSSTYLKYYNNKDNYDVIDDLSGTGISLSEYRNDVTGKGIYQITNTSVLPARSSNPVFFKEDAYMSGDESEISNNQYLLYDNGDVYKRTRYLGYINGTWYYPPNPTFGDWEKLESYYVVF